MRSLFSGLLPLFVLAHLSHHLVTALPVPLLPYIRDEFALDYTRAGFLISAFSVIYGVCQLPAGWLSDRLGPRVLLTIGIVGVGVTGLLAGMSPNYIVLVTALVLMGILGGGYHPASTTMISAAVAPRTRGQALGFHMVGGSFSYFLAPLIAAGIAAAWGWRGPFITLAIPSIGIGIMLHIMLGKRMPSQKAATGDTGVSTEALPATGHRRRLITVVVLSSFTQALLMSIVSFVPLLLVDIYDTGKEMAAVSVSLVYGMGLWAGPFGGYLSDRFGRVAIITIMCLTGSAAIYLFNVLPYGFGTAAILAIIGITIYFNTTAAQAYIADQAAARNRSTVLGFYFFGNMEGTGILTPILGYLIDHFGFHTSFTVSSVAIVITVIVCSAILRLSRR
ncbi:MAG: MFS transporter [Dehalococcoidales bacterium]|nr:MFS transporter [Dehalococcoidales bacterium]